MSFGSQAGRGNRSREEIRRPICNWRSQMTLIKSLLLGSAAGIVAVATAQAADLPTRKAAPVEYVRVCNVGGITGWTLPGSDTCVKFSGYMTAHFIAGNLSSQYNDASAIATTAGAALGIRSRRPSRSNSHGSRQRCFAERLQRHRRYDSYSGAGGALHRSGSAIAALTCPTRRMRSSIAMRSAGTSAPTSALISRRTPPTAR